MTLNQYRTVAKHIRKRIIKLGGNEHNAKGLQLDATEMVPARKRSENGKTYCKLGNGIGLHECRHDSSNYSLAIDGVNNPFNPTTRFHNMGAGQICVYRKGEPSIDITRLRFDSVQLKQLCQVIDSATKLA